MIDLRKQLAMARLPALPQVLLQVLELCGREDTGLQEIGQAVRQDTGVAARLVSVANSAYYNRGRSLNDVQSCVAVLGTATVGRIALSQSVVELFGRFQGGAGMNLPHFWRHALRAALIARELASQWRYPNPEEAYLAGLMHDVGQLALMSVASDRYASLLDSAPDESVLIHQEHEAFELTHAEVGALLAERWRMHPFFVDSLRYHHEPWDVISDAHALTQLTWLADQLAIFVLHPDRVQEPLLQAARVSREGMSALLGKVAEETHRLAEQFGIQLPDDDLMSPVMDDAVAQGRLADLVSEHVQAEAALPPVQTGMAPVSPAMALAQGASMLFGTGKSALFIWQDGELAGLSLDDEDSHLEGLRVRLPNSASVIARAYAGEIVIEAAEGLANLADRQVVRALEGEGLLGLPLVDGGRPYGALIFAADASLLQALRQRERMLRTFAAQASQHFAALMQQQQASSESTRSLLARFELHARKVVHEAGNPLSVVRNYLAMLRERLADDAQAYQDIGLVEQELRRVARILQDFKNIDAQAPLPVQLVDVNAQVNEVLQLCRMGKVEHARIEISSHQEVDLPRVRASADKLKQVLINLIYNALEALPEGGNLMVSTARWRGGKGEDSVEITVADNGPGLPQEVLARLYQSVQSEKGGGHAGLGLSIASGLVREMGGAMQCKTGKTGTSFKILLPILGETSRGEAR